MCKFSPQSLWPIRNRVETTMANYKIPGEHIYDGIVFGEIFPAEVLDAVKKFTFKEDDILIATYPKSGMFLTFYILRKSQCLLKNYMYRSVCTRIASSWSCFFRYHLDGRNRGFGEERCRYQCCQRHTLRWENTFSWNKGPWIMSRRSFRKTWDTYFTSYC